VTVGRLLPARDRYSRGGTCGTALVGQLRELARVALDERGVTARRLRCYPGQLAAFTGVT